MQALLHIHARGESGSGVLSGRGYRKRLDLDPVRCTLSELPKGLLSSFLSAKFSLPGIIFSSGLFGE